MGFVLDKISDYSCDWWPQTCVEMSKLMLVAYCIIFAYIAFNVYLVCNDRGRIATVAAGSELGKEMLRLLFVYGELMKTIKPTELVTKDENGEYLWQKHLKKIKANSLMQVPDKAGDTKKDK